MLQCSCAHWSRMHPSPCSELTSSVWVSIFHLRWLWVPTIIKIVLSLASWWNSDEMHTEVVHQLLPVCRNKTPELCRDGMKHPGLNSSFSILKTSTFCIETWDEGSIEFQRFPLIEVSWIICWHFLLYFFVSFSLLSVNIVLGMMLYLGKHF